MFNIKDLLVVDAGGEIIINEHILIIPKLKAIKTRYKDPLPAFKFLRYKYDFKGPYADVPESEKDEALLRDFPGEYTLEDSEMIETIAWLDGLLTPVQRYYQDNKSLLEKLGAFARTATVEYGRDGNYAALLSQLKSVGKTILEFRQLEKVVDQELEELSNRKNRGLQESGYDE